ncbi:MAG TPA: antibiotic biosynthesis monooxygenase [Gammaproteobacteria bacterium]|nr:antibiotic biosynthesis monooxygenase [Gammaproteobacteria bacterium]
MKRALRALLAVLLMVSPLSRAQQPATAPDPGDRFAVAYVETRADSAAAGRAALERYREAVRAEAGCLGVELFEQAGRRGRFAIVESWRDATTFDARAAEPKRQLLEALRPIRISDYDERPYKSLTLDARTAAGGVAVVSHVDVAPNTQAPELLRTLAERSRGEQGNARFVVLQHVQRANHFTVVEQWQSDAALDAHVAAAHTREYRDALQPLTGSPLDERVYTPISR